MTAAEFQQAYFSLEPTPKAKTVDRLNHELIRQGVNVSFLRPLIQDYPEYFRTYFQVSMHFKESLQEKMSFVEDNFDLLSDWWHTDCLIPWLGNKPDFEYVLEKARQYVTSPLPYVRRWGYVMFIPRLVRDPAKIEPVFSLFHNDNAYHVVMAQAWLISYLAMCAPGRTYVFLRDCDLGYDIVGKAIQKICESCVISQENKERFKSIRPIRKTYR